MKVIINDNTHPGNNLLVCNIISRIQFIFALLGWLSQGPHAFMGNYNLNDMYVLFTTIRLVVGSLISEIQIKSKKKKTSKLL